MEDLINIIPAKFHAPALFLLAISPYLTRAYYSLINGGGIRGVFSAIWLGTNKPKDTNE